ncbi:MAG: hypothetical protein ACSLFP_10475 [Acidimicrobiales bacterium]
MLPLATTTITIERPSSTDPYETPTTTDVACGVAAHIGSPSGNEVDQGGQQERVDAVLLAKAGIGLLHTDLVVDDGTGDRYRVVWVRQRQGLGLDHTRAGLRVYSGAANGA